MSGRKIEVFGQVMMPSGNRKSSAESVEKGENRNGDVSFMNSSVIDVVAYGEARASPDHSIVHITVSSTKLTSEEARSSVQRRLVYIQKTLENCGLEVSKLFRVSHPLTFKIA